MTDREAMKLALEALENHSGNYKLSKTESVLHKNAVDALRQALEQPEQEPVAWMSDSPTKGNGKQLHWTKAEAWRWSSNIAPLYTATPKPAQDLIVGYAENHDIDRAGHDFWVSRQPGKNTVPLYLYGHPPKIWQGLTDEEILEAAGIDGADTWVFETAYAIEAKLKDKNRG